MFQDFINIFFTADYHQVLFRAEYMVRSGEEAGLAVDFRTDNAAVEPGAEIHLADCFSNPFLQGRDFIDGIVLIQLDIIKYSIRRLADGHSFRDIALRVHHFVRAVF